MQGCFLFLPLVIEDHCSLFSTVRHLEECEVLVEVDKDNAISYHKNQLLVTI
jgi:hypothetical protein